MARPRKLTRTEIKVAREKTKMARDENRKRRENIKEFVFLLRDTSSLSIPAISEKCELKFGARGCSADRVREILEKREDAEKCREARIIEAVCRYWNNDVVNPWKVSLLIRNLLNQKSLEEVTWGEYDPERDTCPRQKGKVLCPNSCPLDDNEKCPVALNLETDPSCPSDLLPVVIKQIQSTLLVEGKIQSSELPLDEHRQLMERQMAKKKLEIWTKRVVF